MERIADIAGIRPEDRGAGLRVDAMRIGCGLRVIAPGRARRWTIEAQAIRP